jgi:DNA-binding MarR family transcriptional regulator
MKKLDRKYFEEYKKLYPEMDLEMIQFFARTMEIFHHLPILTESYFQKMGLTKGRFMVLIQLLRVPDEGLSVSEICDFHKVRSATMTGILDTLEKDGQIERLPDPSDRRKVIARITDAGKQLMDDFLPGHQDNIRKMLTGLTVKERQTLLGLLIKLYQGVADFVTDDAEGES